MVATTEQIAASSRPIRMPRLALKRRPSLWASFEQAGRNARRAGLASSLARNPVALGRETGARC